MAIPLPIPLNRTKKCERCTKRYKIKLNECPHCKEIPDGRALDVFIEQHRNKLHANTQLGFFFIAAAVVLLFLMTLVIKF